MCRCALSLSRSLFRRRPFRRRSRAPRPSVRPHAPVSSLATSSIHARTRTRPASPSPPAPTPRTPHARMPSISIVISISLYTTPSVHSRLSHDHPFPSHLHPCSSAITPHAIDVICRWPGPMFLVCALLPIPSASGVCIHLFFLSLCLYLYLSRSRFRSLVRPVRRRCTLRSPRGAGVYVSTVAVLPSVSVF